MPTTETPFRPTESTTIPTRYRLERSAPQVTIPQYSRASILAIWAAAVVPMAVLAWVGAPVLATMIDGPHGFTRALIIALAIGMVWQGVLVALLVWREQRTLRWSVVRDALRLRSPRSPKSGKVGGKLWLLLIPLIALTAAKELLAIPAPASRDMGLFIGSEAGHAFMHGAWGWYVLIVVMFVFNTALGEEMLFRGFLLPRMKGAFGRADWIVNSVLFTLYHVHVPWAMPQIVLDAFTLVYPAKRYQSTLISIAVHSVQTVVFSVLLLGLVMGLA